MKKISIIIPVYCEEKTIEECYKRLTNVLLTLNNYTYELIFIDDGSIDKSLDILYAISCQDTNVKILSLSRNFGHQASISAGLKNTTGDAIVIIDSDLQDPPELIPVMIKYWEDGNDIVYGKRKKRKGETTFKLVTANLFYKTFNKLSNTKIPTNTGDFRLVDKKVVNIINNMPEHHKFFRGLFSWVGFKQTPIEYEREKRFAGKTKYNFKKMANLATDAIIGFSNTPLKIIGGIGLGSIATSILFLLYLLLSNILNIGALSPCFAIIVFCILFFGGLHFFALWIISEYISRIYEQSKNRPEYIINKKINFEKDEK